MSLGVIGTYELVSLLGRGTVAEVYKVRAPDGHDYALKRLLPGRISDETFVSQFAGEADVIRVLDHPNIVKVHEVSTDAQRNMFLVTEYIDGPDGSAIIRRCLERNVFWPIDFAVYTTRVLLQALAHAHHAIGPTGKPLQLVHCDVSPASLHVSRTGEIKLGDFGLAHSEDDPGRHGGKPQYLSPEALEGHATQSADLWAANVTLYELLSLKKPFAGETMQELAKKIRSGERPDIAKIRPDISPKLVAVIDRAFELDEKKRFPSAGAFAGALASLYDERVGTSLGVSAMVRALFGASD